jgi:acetyl esterase/lipase
MSSLKADPMKIDVRARWLVCKLGCGMLFGVSSFAAQTGNDTTGTTILQVWPDKPPGTVTTNTESAMPSRGDNVTRLTDVSEPTLTFYPAPNASAPLPTVVVCPGGGYSILAIDKEGSEVAAWLNSFGFNAAVLKYRVPNNREGAFMDAQRAMRLVRRNAKKWNVDPKRVGIMGFSAGGHLAARISTAYAEPAYPQVDAADKQSCRPDFTILVYPAYLADDEGQLASEVPVNPQTPPAFLLQTRDDKKYVASSIAYDKALKSAGVPPNSTCSMQAATATACAPPQTPSPNGPTSAATG